MPPSRFPVRAKGGTLLRVLLLVTAFFLASTPVGQANAPRLLSTPLDLANSLIAVQRSTGSVVPAPTSTATLAATSTATEVAYCSVDLAAAMPAMQQYNLITLENYSTNADVGGRAFVGHDLTNGDSATFASQLTGQVAATDSTLVVVGNIAAGNPLNLNAGSLRLRGTLNGRIINYNGGGSVIPDTSLSNGAMTTHMEATAHALAVLPTSGNLSLPTNQPGPATFRVTSVSSCGYAVFQITAADLFANALVNQIDLNPGSATTIVINVAGTTVQWSNGANLVGNFTNPTWRSHVIWNFYEATDINFGGHSLNGALLAPFAAVTTQGVIEGGVSVKALTARAAVHQPEFAGDLSCACLATPTATPTNPSVTPSPTSTPIDTPTNTSVPSTATDTATASPTAPYTPTQTPVPPTATATAPSTSTPTKTSLPSTATQTATPTATTADSLAPTIAAVKPAHGSTSLDNELYIDGANFSRNAIVQLRSTSSVTLAAQFLTAKLLLAMVPAGTPPGFYDLLVRNDDGQSATLAAAYTVDAPPVLGDLAADADSLWVDPNAPHAGQPAQIGLVVYRTGGDKPVGVTVRFYDGDPQQGGKLIGAGAIPLLSPRANDSTSAVNWTPTRAGVYQIYAVIDPDNQVAEDNEQNNTMQRTLVVGAADLDQLAPHVDSFTINNAVAKTAELTVKLNTTATDPLTPPPSSGMANLLFVEFLYSQGARRWIPAAVSDWLPYASAKQAYPWSLLPTAGVHYMQAWAADAAGNISLFPYTDRVNYVPPTDKVGQDQTRVYRVDLAAGQRLQVSVIPVSGDPDLYVWPPDYATRPPWVSNLDGSAPESLDFVAPIAGAYQIEIYGYTAAEYQLQFNVSSVNAAAAPAQVGGVSPDKPALTEPSIPVNDVPPGQQAVPPAPATTTAPSNARFNYLPFVQR